MKCYYCGATLTKHDFCTACKSDVRQYKLIIEASNRKYNEGLERAEVRDLSGAITCLRQSLKLNKENLDARNLLGLVYFETGEIVEALSEWIISKNLQPEKNIAEDYINRVQQNQSKLDTYNQAIVKYNQAVELCYQGSDDLAIIQLKKVISMNPKFVKANLLLALLYMNKEEYDKAHPILKRTLQIDRGNTQAQTYLREVSRISRQKNGKSKGKPKEDIVRYERDNELIIQPAQVVEPKTSTGTLVGFVIGFLLGAALLFFLVMPARLQSVRSQLDEAVRNANESKESQTVTITNLEKQVELLTQQIDSVTAQYGNLYGEDINQEAVTSLINALQAYLADPNDLEGISTYLNVCAANDSYFEENSNGFLTLYDTLMAAAAPKLAESYYNTGYNAYFMQDYDGAVDALDKAVLYDTESVDALFYLASAYQAQGNTDKATELFNDLLERFPGSNRVNQAQRAIDAMAQSTAE